MAWHFVFSLKLSQLSWCERGPDGPMTGSSEITSTEYGIFLIVSPLAVASEWWVVDVSVDLEEDKVSVYMQNFLIKQQIQSQDISCIPIALPGGFVGLQLLQHTSLALCWHWGRENAAIGPFCLPISAVQTSGAISVFHHIPKTSVPWVGQDSA